MVTAIFPGSFDPVTLGHVDLIRRAAKLCERLIVGVLNNPDKDSLFTVSQRVSMLTAAVSGISGVEILHFSGLLADFARAQGATFIVRGVRGVTDLEVETPMAHANGLLLPGLETVLLPASASFASVSSSLVRQIARFGGDITAFVPTQAVDEITRRFYNREQMK